MFVKNGDNGFNVKQIVTEKQGKVQFTCPICLATYEEGTFHNCQAPKTEKEDEQK